MEDCSAAESLVGLLSLLGFSEAESIAPALREACQDQDSREIVNWLAANLKPEHVAHIDQHSRQYQLSSQQLATAAAFSQSLAGTREDPTDFAESGVTEARERTAALLAGAANKLADEAVEEAEAAELAGVRSLAKIEALKAEINAQVTGLGEELTALDAAVQELGGALAGGKGPGTLLCLQDLQEFRTADEDLMAALRGFHSAQFCSDAAQQDLAEGWSSGALQEADKLLRCDDEAAAARRALEVERIRLAHESGLEGKVRMQALLAKQEQTLAALQGGLTRKELGSQDAAMLRTEGERQQAYLEKVLERKRHILDRELPQLCGRLASMQCLDVIKAEYDIELQRTKYHSQKKEVVMDALAGRAARVAALAGAARSEAGHLAAAGDCLGGILERTTQINAATQLRLEKCEIAQDLPLPEEQLPSSPSKAPTAGTIKRKQSEFGAQLGHVMQQVIPGMHAASGQIHSLAFSMPAIEDAELSSKELLSARSSLEAGHRKLVLADDKVYKQQEKYNTITKQQREQVGAERAVFSKFFTRPQALAGEAATLEGRPAKKTPARTPVGRRPVKM